MKLALCGLVALTALVVLWLTYWGPGVTQDPLPPLRPLEQPTHSYNPLPETKEYNPPNPTHNGGESIQDVRDS